MLEEFLIRLGEINDTAMSRIKNIGSILPEAKKYNQKIKYIDLRWDDSYYLRLKESKEEIKKEMLPKKEDKKEIKEEEIKIQQAAKIEAEEKPTE